MDPDMKPRWTGNPTRNGFLPVFWAKIQYSGHGKMMPRNHVWLGFSAALLALPLLLPVPYKDGGMQQDEDAVQGRMVRRQCEARPTRAVWTQR